MEPVLGAARLQCRNGVLIVLKLTLDEPDALFTVAHAIASKVRIDIIRLLNTQKLNIVDIADQLNLPVSTVAFNVRVLEAAGLVITETVPAKRGTMKICSRNLEIIQFKLKQSEGYKSNNNCYMIEMPIGQYCDCDVYPTCGLMNSNGSIPPSEEPAGFYHPQCITASLLWFRKGYVEYKFPSMLPSSATMKSLQFSMELCSEAPGFNHNWPSDITAWINGVEIGTWTCPGDFGDRRGKLNPSWIIDNHTQYGLLKNWKVDDQGTYLDDVKLSDITLGELQLQIKKPIRFRIGVKHDARNIGGINLLGKQFGDYEQDIIMRIMYT
jgi:predicted transcriptional regulator